MRRFTTTLIFLTVFLTLQAGYTKGYYDRMDGKQKEELKSAVKQCVSSHRKLVYGELPQYWQYTDVYPELVNGNKRWWDMYSDRMCLIYEYQTAFQSFSANRMNREHSVPKSWWKKNGDVEYTPAYSDLWNLYPSDAEANSAKLNYPFGPTDKPVYDNGVTKVGYPKTGYGGGASRVFEPADEYKGDFARAFFYMACVYDDINWVINYMFRKETWPTLTPWAMNMLLQWARTDKVSQKEIDRNNLVEQYQGNRNPFVDFPELAEYIWGVRTSETFIIAQQENTDPTPPITGDPTISEPVNGETLDFGQTAEGHDISRALQIRGSNFTSPLSLRVIGANKDKFIPEVTEIPASTLNAGGGYLLNIIYRPSATGQHEARLTLYDGGLDGSVVVTLRGEALPVPELTALTALEPKDVTDSAYTACWLPADGIADYYTVTRVRYNEGGEEAETYETNATELRMSGRDAGVAETYSVTYSRLGLVSPASNTIYVAASGMESMQYEVPFRAIGSDGCITILSGDGMPIRSLTITDPAGRIVMVLDARDGMEIPIASGMYIIMAPGHRPHKLIVK